MARGLSLPELLVSVAVFATFLVTLAALQVLVFSRSRSQTQRQDLSLRVFVSLDRFKSELDGAYVQSIRSVGTVLQYRRLILHTQGMPALNSRGGLLYEATSQMELANDGWITTRLLSGSPARRLAFLGPNSSWRLQRPLGNPDVLSVEMTARQGTLFWTSSRSLLLRGQR
jgi:hypothetical protein